VIANQHEKLAQCFNYTTVTNYADYCETIAICCDWCFVDSTVVSSDLITGQMNLHTFKDAIKSKRSSLANDIIDDDDDDAPIVLLKREVEGEEDEGHEQVR